MDLPGVELVARPATRAQLPAPAPGDAYLAGGSWLFSTPQPGLRRLVDLAALRWPAVTVRDDGIELAATCTLAELAALEVPAHWPALALARECCEALRGSFKVWNAATVGGNLCLALPAGPIAALAAALDAHCTIWEPGGGERELHAAELITGPGRTALQPGELLRAVTLPARWLAARTALRRASLTTHGRSAALVIGRVDAAGRLLLTITAATPRPVQLRLPAIPDRVELAGRVAEAGDEAGWFDDVHGDPAWRRHLTQRLAGEVAAELAA